MELFFKAEILIRKEVISGINNVSAIMHKVVTMGQTMSFIPHSEESKAVDFINRKTEAFKS